MDASPLVYRDKKNYPNKMTYKRKIIKSTIMNMTLVLNFEVMSDKCNLQSVLRY